MNKTYFITGGTGFVGKNIIQTMLEKEPDSKFIVLARDCNGISAVKRLEKIFCMFDNYEEIQNRITILEGNITEDQFGLSGKEYENLAKTVNIIFHSAASVKFNLPMSEAYIVNVKGTENLLKFANQCYQNNVLERYNHISTAYVVGRQKINISELCENNFANTYEATKSIAEDLVQQYGQEGLPFTIFRPSIISGNSETGEISTNSIVFIFLSLLMNERLSQIPCNKDTSLNIVSINYVIDLIYKISKMPEALGNVYNITSEENISFSRIIEFICHSLNLKVPEFVPIHNKHLLPKKLLNSIGQFISYFEESHHFNLTNTRNLLNCNYIYHDDFKTGLMRIIKFCLDSKLLVNKKLNTEFCY